MDYKEKVIALLNSQELSKEQKEKPEDIFPELRESEDERIKTFIRGLLLPHIADSHIEGDKIVHNKDIDNYRKALAWLEKQGEQKPNPYSGTSFEYNGHTWGMCARDNGVEILIDGHIKGRVFTNDSNAKEMFIKALERVEEQNSKGYKLTDCDKNSWWEDFKAYASCTIEQKPAEWSEEDEINLEKAIWYVENPAPMVVKDSMLVDWLKSLKERCCPQKHWKPSRKQIEAIRIAAEVGTANNSWAMNVLKDLYEQLKAL